MDIRHSTPVRSPETLGDALSRARRERGLSQSELAETLGVSRKYIYEIEKGEPNLYARRLFEILRELNLRIDLAEEAEL